LGTDETAQNYYASLEASGIAAPITFSDWLQAYGFNSLFGYSAARAIYYNSGDLGLGRDMNCRRNQINGNVACYVWNHGFGAGASKQHALQAAVGGYARLAAVAMVYTSSLEGQPNDVSFFIYGERSPQYRFTVAFLDSQEPKYLPQLCLSCHGGSRDGDDVVGASFLPFDTSSFAYSREPSYNLVNQQEQFRKLNAMVRATNPSPQITQLIDGWYASSGGVNTPGAIPDRSFIPPNFQGSFADRQLYLDVVKPYCRTCHIAQSAISLDSPADFDATARSFVFDSYLMPHAEKTNRDFWRGNAPAFLAAYRGWSLLVTRYDDPVPNGCNPGDCSLREAIIAANANPDKSIITFQSVLFPIYLSRSGADDTASLGDLDITEDLVLLGNVALPPIIDGNGFDRVFHILNGANVVIQGVAIEGGVTNGQGGGINHQSGFLALNASILRENAAFSGGGLAVQDGAVAEVNESAIHDNSTESSGGGITNLGGALTVTNSTISSNFTNFIGGGLYTTSGVSPDSGSLLLHTTVALNQAVSGVGAGLGGGIYTEYGLVTVRNSIIAGNSADSLNEADCGGDVYDSRGRNLVGQNGSPNGCWLGDLVLSGPIQTALEPTLTTGGGIPVHPLVKGSQGIDAIAADGIFCGRIILADLHNTARPLDGDYDGVYACDIGPLEYDPPLRTFLPIVVH
jgi:CSLREA domain-containing protein